VLFHSAPLFAGGELSLESFFDRAIELKAQSVDITTYYLKNVDRLYLTHLRNLAFRNGVPIAGAACKASLLLLGSETQESSLAEMKKWIDVAEALGAPHLRVFPGKAPSGASKAESINTLVEAFKRAADYAGSKGIILGMENQNGLADNSETCLEIIGRVNSPFAGLTLDITHFVRTASRDYYSQIAACIPVATQTHLRNGNFDDGSPIDLERIGRIFAEAGYRGYMSAEYESSGRSRTQIMTDVPILMAEIRRLCATYSGSGANIERGRANTLA
jgi:sugar phosphate isomerase/epimerase